MPRPPKATAGEDPLGAPESTKGETTGEASVAETVDLSVALESFPPGRRATIAVLGRLNHTGRYEFLTSDIRIHCPDGQCTGVRLFFCENSSGVSVDEKWSFRFLYYKCRNCGISRRTFAIRSRLTQGPAGEIEKLGEVPAFGPFTPPRVISLIGPERDSFLKGRRAETQGLGIGAFSYYRRVVESQWQRLIGQIIKVAERLEAPPEMLTNLMAASKESQFSRAVELIKDGIPDVLKVKGHNPLTVLYAALSDGLHAASDEHCLELAGSVRVVLTDLAERIDQALKDQTELHQAVSKLLAKRAKPG